MACIFGDIGAIWSNLADFLFMHAPLGWLMLVSEQIVRFFVERQIFTFITSVLDCALFLACIVIILTYAGQRWVLLRNLEQNCAFCAFLCILCILCILSFEQFE